jgi:uncharacterized membrane protein
MGPTNCALFPSRIHTFATYFEYMQSGINLRLFVTGLSYFFLLLVSQRGASMNLQTDTSVTDTLAMALPADSTDSMDSLAIDTVNVPSALASDLAPVPSSTFISKLFTDPILPFILVLLALFVITILVFRYLSNTLRKLRQGDETLSPGKAFDTAVLLEQSNATVNSLTYISAGMISLYLLYVGVKGTESAGYAMEWLNLLVRWAHVVVGIMWIGASFYFIFLENHLNRTEGVRDELAGNLWAIHGGGFYFLEKYKVAPSEIPKKLHWFKYEAYFTWITGVALLIIVYYMDAKAYLIDPSVADLSPATAIALGITTLIAGWFIYDTMCRSPLIKRQDLFALAGIIFITILAYVLTHLFNSRAAFIHVGALLGTIMAGNVFFNIIPSQKALVRAALTGEPLDAGLGKRAGQRSLHNNYITLPVIFIMISNHYPSTFGHKYNWIILLIIILGSAGIKHYWNLAERGIRKKQILAISAGMIIVLAVLTSPAVESTVANAMPVEFSEVNTIFQNRCVQCHSANPTDDQWKAAPNGVMYDTPEQIANMSDKILIRAVRTHTMPQGNKTKMTEEEREIVGRWILQGAKIPQ